jgi:hypothetical protein
MGKTQSFDRAFEVSFHIVQALLLPRFMADFSPVIETIEHRLMRAWVNRDMRTLKALTSRNFRMVIASKPPILLDAKSWLEAAATRYVCRAYRFSDIYARQLGSVAVFATQLELDAMLDEHDWSGQFWITDLWRKGSLRRSWRLTDRLLSRVEIDPDLPSVARSLQLWR